MRDSLKRARVQLAEADDPDTKKLLEEQVAREEAAIQDKEAYHRTLWEPGRSL